MNQSKTCKPAVAAAALCLGIVGLVAPRLRSYAEDAPPPPPLALTMATQAPKGAVLLITGLPDQIKNNFFKRYSTDPAGWTFTEGATHTDGKDIVTRAEFGDCFVHVEFHEPVDAQGNGVGGGNSGVAFMSRYEVQILNSYGHKPEAHECGALYSEKAPIVIANRPPNEWQTYDIIFRAPRFDGDGKVVEHARATVIQNGIIVQNNEEFTGPTGIQYGEMKGEVKTGPLLLQGDHDPVMMRNVWVVPLASAAR